jgi:hypothetical protein
VDRKTWWISYLTWDRVFLDEVRPAILQKDGHESNEVVICSERRAPQARQRIASDSAGFIPIDFVRLFQMELFRAKQQ